MFVVYDVQVELPENVKLADILKLRDHLKALSMRTVGLESTDYKPRAGELNFSVYGDAIPFLMRQMVNDCTRNVFPESIVNLVER